MAGRARGSGRVGWAHVGRAHVGSMYLGNRSILYHGRDPGALRYVPADNPRIDYFKIARRAVMRDGRLLAFVPPSYPSFKLLATIAIKQSKYALGYVPKDHECYAEMAELHEKRMTPPSPTHKYEYFYGHSWEMQKDL